MDEAPRARRRCQNGLIVDPERINVRRDRYVVGMGENEGSPWGNEGSPRGNDVHTAADTVATRRDDDSIERSVGGRGLVVRRVATRTARLTR